MLKWICSSTQAVQSTVPPIQERLHLILTVYSTANLKPFFQVAGVRTLNRQWSRVGSTGAKAPRTRRRAGAQSRHCAAAALSSSLAPSSLGGFLSLAAPPAAATATAALLPPAHPGLASLPARRGATTAAWRGGCKIAAMWFGGGGGTERSGRTPTWERANQNFFFPPVLVWFWWALSPLCLVRLTVSRLPSVRTRMWARAGHWAQSQAASCWAQMGLGRLLGFESLWTSTQHVFFFSFTFSCSVYYWVFLRRVWWCYIRTNLKGFDDLQTCRWLKVPHVLLPGLWHVIIFLKSIANYWIILLKELVVH